MQSWDILPKDFLEKIELLYPSPLGQSILQSFSQKKPTSFRRNSLTTSKDELLQTFNDNGITYQEVPWYQDAFITTSPASILTSLPAYTQGKFYIQGLSSMIPPLVLSPLKDEKILDLAAAPGSKTTQLASLMGNSGEIVANDTSRTRLFKLRANLSQQKVTNVKILNTAGERIWRNFPEYFDKVLVDVPCTMEGRFDTSDPKSFKDWSSKKVKELSHLQKYLLRSAITATKVGGTIIYSTCTLSTEENEGVIDWILEKEGKSITIEPISIPQLSLQPGITSWKKKAYHPDTGKTARILPSEQMEGFFIAKIKKVSSSLTPELLMDIHR